jgi:hypothetical protein
LIIIWDRGSTGGLSGRELRIDFLVSFSVSTFEAPIGLQKLQTPMTNDSDDDDTRISTQQRTNVITVLDYIGAFSSSPNITHYYRLPVGNTNSNFLIATQASK